MGNYKSARPTAHEEARPAEPPDGALDRLGKAEALAGRADG